MKPEEIDYRTDIVEPYCAAIRACANADALRAELAENWTELCPDAVTLATSLTDEDWAWAKKHAKHAKHAARVCQLAGAVLLPVVVLRVGILASDFHVPDGCAYIRMIECEKEKPSGE